MYVCHKLTPKKILIALEQVVPVVPHGMFSVMIRNEPSMPLQWSCEDKLPLDVVLWYIVHSTSFEVMSISYFHL